MHIDITQLVKDFIMWRHAYVPLHVRMYYCQWTTYVCIHVERTHACAFSYVQTCKHM
jgi:hypothetical protein